MIRNKKPSARLLRLLNRELRPGERVLWRVRPDPRELAGREHVTLQATLWIVLLVFMTSPLFFIVRDKIALWFLLLVPYGFAVRWVLRSRTRALARARATLYAITNRRAIVLMAWRSLDVSSFYLDDIVKLVRRERRNGTGDLILRQELVPAGDDSVMTEAGFVALYRPRRVERLLEQARLEARSAKASQKAK